MKWLAPFKAIWKFINGSKAEASFNRIDSMIEVALPIVKRIAELTPTRDDDEILKLFTDFGLGVPLAAWRMLPLDERGKVLLSVGEKALAKQFPQAPINEISSAVSLAVSALKASK